MRAPTPHWPPARPRVGRRASPWPALVVGAVVAAGCSVQPTDGANPFNDTRGGDRPTTDAAGDTAPDAGPRELLACDRDDATSCPGGMECDARAEVCVDCIFASARCGADGGLERCDKPVVGFGGELIGGFFEPAPCEAGEVCVPNDASSASCQPAVCEPLDAWCLDDKHREVCSSWGHASATVQCDTGRTCRGEGQCDLIRHNVLLVIDTSGSMMSYIDRPGTMATCADHDDLVCPEPFPTCETIDNPLSLLTQAKIVFGEILPKAVGGHVRFALQRFPQLESMGHQGNCWSGWYIGTPATDMTGDDDSRETRRGGWFDCHLGEAIVAPFPSADGDSNLEPVSEWMDLRETRGFTDIPCTVGAECPSGGCGEINGEKKCMTHRNPELRVGGETPLGKALFYAGEYYRRFVLIDGQDCQTDADCDSAGYKCTPDGCRDKWRQCKKNHIILFTDGNESEFKTFEEFFNPAVQAKRLKSGLDCQTDADCRDTASCLDGICLAPNQVATTFSGFAGGDGYGALSSPGGDPISITTSVMTLSAVATEGTVFLSSNDIIARAGGGKSLNVFASDPEDFLLQLRQLLQIEWKCDAE